MFSHSSVRIEVRGRDPWGLNFEGHDDIKHMLPSKLFFSLQQWVWAFLKNGILGGEGGQFVFVKKPLFLKLSSISSLYIQRLSSNESPRLVKSGTKSSTQSRLLSKDRWTQVARRPCQTHGVKQAHKTTKPVFSVYQHNISNFKYLLLK